MCQSEIEEDLQYNISRKEELKKEVKEIKDYNEELRQTNWSNVKYTMTIKTENNDMKKRIEELANENDELKSLKEI